MLLFSCSPANRHIENEQENWCLPPLLKGTIPLGEEAWIKATMVHDDSKLAFPPRRWKKMVETGWSKSERVELLFARETADDRNFGSHKPQKKTLKLLFIITIKKNSKLCCLLKTGLK